MVSTHLRHRLFSTCLLSIGLLIGAVGGGLFPSPVEAGAWRTDFEQAQADARAQQKALLVHFYADWCGPCRRMEREVLASRQLTSQFEQRIIAVKINSDHHPGLVQRYGVRALPSDLLFAPSGKVIARSEGYQSAGQYLSKVAAVTRKYPGRPPKTEVAQTPRSEDPPEDRTDPQEDPTPQPRTPDTARVATTEPEEREADGDASADVAQTDPQSDPREVAPVEQVPVDPPSAIVGLDSYSPVALWSRREWRRGKPEFAHEFRGVVYYMADTEELEQFQKDPRRYAPRLLGCDPVVLAETDRAIPGDTQYGAYFDGGLFLFRSEQSRAKFKTSPLRYSRTQHAIRVQDFGQSRLR